mmetsp:Transcript_13555/g.43745  ORF Transcript_13555/g.43745 Transcript_13555/m.43745 type:complete len:89 (-) Transcript_13555:382-648(-)
MRFLSHSSCALIDAISISARCASSMVSVKTRVTLGLLPTEWSPETDSCDDILSLIFTKIGALVTSVAPPHLFGYKRLGAILLEQTLAA